MAKARTDPIEVFGRVFMVSTFIAAAVALGGWSAGAIGGEGADRADRVASCGPETVLGGPGYACGSSLTVAILSAGDPAGPFRSEADWSVATEPQQTSPEVAVEVESREGWQVLDGSCGTSLLESAAVDWQDWSFEVDVGSGDDVVCRLRVVATNDDEGSDEGGSAASEAAGSPILAIEKTAESSVVPAGSVVTYEIAVTNGGSGQLGDVVVRDPGCGDLVGPVRTGDDGDVFLDPGERWLYRCDAVVTADVTNVAGASAWAVDAAGQRTEGGGVRARATRTVRVGPPVGGSTEVPPTTELAETGLESPGLLIGAAGLLGLGLLLVVGRRAADDRTSRRDPEQRSRDRKGA